MVDTHTDANATRAVKRAASATTNVRDPEPVLSRRGLPRRTGDALLPQCSRCARAGRKCIQKAKIRFKAHRFDGAAEHASGPVTHKDQSHESMQPRTEPLDYTSHEKQNSEEVLQSRVFEDRHGFVAIPSGSGFSRPQLHTEQDALLYRHFVDTVSTFFDFCDPARHFGRMVPQKARRSSTLCSAILALSARHLSRVTNFDAVAADVYYQNCLQQLIPVLSEVPSDDSVLAALVILRLLEEFDVPLTGHDPQSHLFGTRAIIQAQGDVNGDDDAVTDFLRAVHLAALRQDLYMALTMRRTMQAGVLDLVRAVHEPSQAVGHPHAERQEAEWANTAVLHCCNVAHFVFGSDHHETSVYTQLEDAHHHWEKSRPASFDPFYSGTTPEGFVDTRYLADWHVMGETYHLLAGLLLTVYSSYASQSDKTVPEGSARGIVLRMVGIARANPQAPSAMLVSCMAISLCDKVNFDVATLKTLYEILVETERLTGWPTRSARQALGQSGD